MRDPSGERVEDPRPSNWRLRDVARTLLAIAAIAPGLIAGVVTLVVTRDRRRALNRALMLWGDQGTRAAGIRLHVCGERHLECRPAVFLINHRSGIDPILVCALLKRDFVGVAKAEIKRNPVLGPAFAFAGTVFLERADRASAIDSLGPAVETLRRGYAIAMAPEGTRSRATGRFKKGGFHIAMEAAVPLVPIVVHDADRVLPRGGWVMRAATVHVTVHAPIPTGDWDRASLDAEIAAVEQLYRETLERGPAA